MLSSSLELKQFPRSKDFPTFSVKLPDDSTYTYYTKGSFVPQAFCMPINRTTDVFYICIKETRRPLDREPEKSKYFPLSSSSPRINSYLFKLKLDYGKILSACLSRTIAKLSVTYLLPNKTLYAELYFKQRGGDEIYLVNLTYRVVIEV